MYVKETGDRRDEAWSRVICLTRLLTEKHIWCLFPFVVSRVVANIVAEKTNPERQVDQSTKSQQWPNMAGDYSQSPRNRCSIKQVNLITCLKCRRSDAFHNELDLTQGKLWGAQWQLGSFMYMTFDMMGGLGERTCLVQPCKVCTFVLTPRGA